MNTIGPIRPPVRVTCTPAAIYSKPRACTKRRRCAGHLADAHWIEVGEPIIWSALPPDSDDIGNIGWWHSAYCQHCAPIHTIEAS